MSDEAVVLGATCSAAGDRLSVWFVVLRCNADGSIDVLELDPWYATKGTDEPSQLVDVHDATVNRIDAKRLGDVDAAAVKRTEMPPGRPSKQYDRKVRFEASVMMAAQAAGKRYHSYRTQEIRSRSEWVEAALGAPGAPEGKEARDALIAACAALSDLG